jgi:hypothetical protein
LQSITCKITDPANLVTDRRKPAKPEVRSLCKGEEKVAGELAAGASPLNAREQL